jgi:uncharacterized membrane protein
MTPNPGPPVPASPGLRRGLRVVLAISLTFNLLVIGLILGAWVGHDRDRRPGTALDDIGFGPFLAALPGDERRAVGKALVERSGNLRQNREALRRDFDNLVTAIRADPFDIAAVASALDAQRTRLEERQSIGRDVLFERLEAMTARERDAFADALERKVRRGPMAGMGDHHD